MRKYRDPAPSYEPPEGKEMPICPCCNCEAETLYRNMIGEIVGCDCCLVEMDVKDAREASA